MRKHHNKKQPNEDRKAKHQSEKWKWIYSFVSWETFISVRLQWKMITQWTTTTNELSFAPIPGCWTAGELKIIPQQTRPQRKAGNHESVQNESEWKAFTSHRRRNMWMTWMMMRIYCFRYLLISCFCLTESCSPAGVGWDSVVGCSQFPFRKLCSRRIGCRASSVRDPWDCNDRDRLALSVWIS